MNTFPFDNLPIVPNHTFQVLLTISFIFFLCYPTIFYIDKPLHSCSFTVNILFIVFDILTMVLFHVFLVSIILIFFYNGYYFGFSHSF